MPKQPRIDRWVRLVAVLIGLAVATVAILSWRMPAASGRADLDLTVTASPVGQVELSPAGPVLRGGTMSPGAAAAGAHGTLALTNTTAAPLVVQLRAQPSSRHIDTALWMEVSAGREQLVRGPLASLRGWTRHRFVLPPAARKTLEVRAWLPRSSQTGWVGRIETVALQVRGQPRPGARVRR